MKPKLTSVNRLIMLYVVPQIKETYNNVDLLFQFSKINNISFKFVSDFKLLYLMDSKQLRQRFLVHFALYHYQV